MRGRFAEIQHHIVPLDVLLVLVGFLPYRVAALEHAGDRAVDEGALRNAEVLLDHLETLDVGGLEKVGNLARMQ